MKRALLWRHLKENGTTEHIRQISALISDFTRMQVDSRKRKTLRDVKGNKGLELARRALRHST